MPRRRKTADNASTDPYDAPIGETPGRSSCDHARCSGSLCTGQECHKKAAQAHAVAWLAGEAMPDLGQLAIYVLAGDGMPPSQVEERLTTDLDTAIFEVEHDLAHGQALPGARRRLAQLRAKRDRCSDAWYAALGAADYHADKLAELEGATAANAVARWNLLDGSPRLPVALPSAEAPGPLPHASTAELHAAVLSHVASFFARSNDTAARVPRILLTAETGSRKTGIALRHLRIAIAGLPYRAVMAVPAHRLGREIEERARGEGINAAVFLGRGDPHKPNQPCRNLEAVGLARQAGADLRTAVCGPAPGGARCGFRDDCDYFAGLERAKAADLMIVAHNFLFEQLPAALKHDLAWVVVDEDFAALADRIFDLTLDTLAPETLARFPVLADDGTADAHATPELQRLHDMIHTAARACIDGYLTADALRSAGFTAVSDAPARMRALTWRRKQPVQMRPGMEIEARKAAVRLAAVNAQLPGIAALAHALDAMLAPGTAGAGLVFASICGAADRKPC